MNRSRSRSRSRSRAKSRTKSRSKSKSNSNSNVNAHFTLKKRVGVKSPGGTEYTFNNPYPKVQKFYKYRMLMDEALTVAEDGIYTWILKSGHIFAVKTESAQEIGTLHVNLDEWTKKYGDRKNIVAAGEIKKEGERLLFNLLSGTYMEPRMRKAAKEGKLDTTEREIQTVVEEKLLSIGLHPVYLHNHPIIDNLPPTLPNVLARYTSQFASKVPK